MVPLTDGEAATSINVVAIFVTDSGTLTSQVAFVSVRAL